MKRDEFVYRVLLPIYAISAMIAVPIMQTDVIPTWIPGPILSLIVLVFLGGFCVFGYYEFHDPQRSYKCKACGYATTIARAPYSTLEKGLFGFFGFIIALFLVLLTALIISSKMSTVF